MPKKGAFWRSEQLTYIAKVLHKRNSSDEFFNLIQSAKNELLDIERNSDNQHFIKDKERNIHLLLKLLLQDPYPLNPQILVLF